MQHSLLGIRGKHTSICNDLSDYVDCLYESKWWVGLVIEVDREDQDVFHWPEPCDDICWVSVAHVLAKVEVPTTASGRQYHLASRDNCGEENLVNKSSIHVKRSKCQWQILVNLSKSFSFAGKTLHMKLYK